MPRPRLSQLTYLIVALLIGAGVVFAACGGDDEPDGPADDVKIVLQWVVQAQFAGYYVALEKGFYEDENLNVEIQPGGPRHPAGAAGRGRRGGAGGPALCGAVVGA